MKKAQKQSQKQKMINIAELLKLSYCYSSSGLHAFTVRGDGGWLLYRFNDSDLCSLQNVKRLIELGYTR